MACRSCHSERSLFTLVEVLLPASPLLASSSSSASRQNLQIVTKLSKPKICTHVNQIQKKTQPNTLKREALKSVEGERFYELDQLISYSIEPYIVIF